MRTTPIVNPINAFPDLFFDTRPLTLAALFLAGHGQVCNIDTDSYTFTGYAVHVVFLYAEWLDALL